MSETQCHMCYDWFWEFQIEADGNCHLCNKKFCGNCGLKFEFLSYKVYDFDHKIWLCAKCEEVEL